MSKAKIFYDASCPFCTRWKARIEKLDKNRIFSYASIDKSAKTLILIEPNGKQWTRGKAVFRIFWLLKYYFPGCLYVLPSFVLDPLYRLIAKFRYKLD